MTGDTTVRRTPAGCRRTLVSITAAVTERFHLANMKLLVKELLRGGALRTRVINGRHGSAVGLLLLNV